MAIEIEINRNNRAAITEETFTNICKAKDTLCKFCETDECDFCMVNRLYDAAYIEALHEGIVEEI